MGVAQAGLVFRRTTAVNDLPSLIAVLCKSNAVLIPHPNFRDFDIRRHDDIMVQNFGDVCFISNNDLVWDYLADQEKDVTELYKILGSPDEILIFCHYESGGSFGYAFIEQGQRTRSRLQTTGVPQLPPLMESGVPKDFENLWLTAKHYLEEDDVPPEERNKVYYQGDREIEVSEYNLTSRMLYEALQKYFSVCPWETDLEPEYYFFKLTKEEKKWWRFW